MCNISWAIDSIVSDTESIQEKYGVTNPHYKKGVVWGWEANLMHKWNEQFLAANPTPKTTTGDFESRD